MMTTEKSVATALVVSFSLYPKLSLSLSLSGELCRL
jgi:hypothetical protein